MIIFNSFDGGGKRDRTDDLLHAMQALSQLSYTPLKHNFRAIACVFFSQYTHNLCTASKSVELLIISRFSVD
jgi:hypothetical protein